MRSQLTRAAGHPRVIHLVAALTLLYTGYYLYWRAHDSLNPAALWLAIPLLLVEVHGALNLVLFAFMTWDIRPLLPVDAPPDRSVDIFIPTYNEDLAILRLTILGALNVRYPHETWVLDDGRRASVRALCAEVGAHYLTRPDNAHAKAGNINAALAHTRGEFIAIFDADQVPLPEYLDKTLGYFADPALAFVQTPQEYYNLDSMQHRADRRSGAPWHEQSLFYRVIQPAKNRWNAAFWCGSNSVIRRSALEQVGGIATGSVTEDIKTSLRLHAAGWRSLQLDEVLALGLAPHDFLAFTVQRLRWAQGAMQVLRQENPLYRRGLTLAQRLNYLASLTTYLEAFQRLAYLLAPAIVLMTGVLPIHVPLGAFAPRFLPYLVLGLVANCLLGRGLFRPLETERYNMLKMATFIKATATLIGCAPTRFKVTPKAASEDTRAIAALLRPYSALGVVIAGAMVIGWLRILGVWGQHATTGVTPALLLTEGWALYNLWLVVHGVRSARRHITRRATYRFPAHVAVTARAGERTLTGWTDNLHQHGASLLVNGALPLGEALDVCLHLPRAVARGTLEVRSSRPAGGDAQASQWYGGGVFTPHGQDDTTALHTFLIGIMRAQLESYPAGLLHAGVSTPVKEGLVA